MADVRKIDYLGLLQRLNDNQVEFVVIGGIAANLLGSPQVTYDLDVCTPMSEQNISRIVAALRDVHPRFRFHLKKKPLPEDPAELHGFKNLNLETDLGIIDLLGELPNISSFEDLAGKTTIMEVFGMRFRVLDLDTLLAAKKSAGRMKDLANICQLEAIKRMREQQPPRPFDPPDERKP